MGAEFIEPDADAAMSTAQAVKQNGRTDTRRNSRRNTYAQHGEIEDKQKDKIQYNLDNAGNDQAYKWGLRISQAAENGGFEVVNKKSRHDGYEPPALEIPGRPRV